MKKLLPFLLFVFSFGNLYAQTDEAADFEAHPTSINDVIRGLGDDTVVFFFNERWQLVKPVCATTFRIAKVDTVQFTYTGTFVDYYTHDSAIAVEGHYANGKKEGRFNIYYPNGQLEQTGHYVDDKKSGLWVYYYHDGSRRQILDFKEAEVLITDFWDEQGKQMVTAGNGEWYGYDAPEKFIKTTGEVLNGRKHGTWKNTIVSRNMTTNIEKYKEGQFISGKMISIARGTDAYKDSIYCTIEKAPAFVAAELFQVNRCYKKQDNNWDISEYPGGMRRFYSQIREKLKISDPVIKRGVMKVSMTIDAYGKMGNFKPVTNIGHEADLIRVLQTLDHWTPTKINGKPTIRPMIISFEIW